MITMLGKLKVGEKGKVADLSMVNRLVRRRLLDLGITVGTEVCIKGIMPFGGPFMLESHGQCVGIRRIEALQIKVERI